MPLSDLYVPLRNAHVAFVLASGSLFAVRGLAVIGGARWAMAARLRGLSYSIDTLLVAAAMLLLLVLRLNPFVTPWLVIKLSLLLPYIALGSLALKRARSARLRLLSYVAALLCFGLMLLVATTHDPLQLLHPWRGLLPNDTTVYT